MGVQGMQGPWFSVHAAKAHSFYYPSRQDYGRSLPQWPGPSNWRPWAARNWPLILRYGCIRSSHPLPSFERHRSFRIRPHCVRLRQFQNALRDREGRGLTNAHILGFLRRISKLLYYGIKPVFVFDGEAPLLKKQTIVKHSTRIHKSLEALASHFRLPFSLLFLSCFIRYQKERKKRKQGGQENLAKTAEKLLAAQLRQAAVVQAQRCEE